MFAGLESESTFRSTVDRNEGLPCGCITSIMMGILLLSTAVCGPTIRREMDWQSDPNNNISRSHPLGDYRFRRNHDGSISISAFNHNEKAPELEIARTCGKFTRNQMGDFETSISNYQVSTEEPDCFDKLKAVS
jgi:hypothetical protein